MSENKVVLSLQNVTKKFGKLTVLDDMSLDVHEHEIVVLCGPSGGGVRRKKPQSQSGPAGPVSAVGGGASAGRGPLYQ